MTTREAVRGMARIMPRMPLRAMPQKKMERMMVMG